MRGHHVVAAILVASWLPATGILQGIIYAAVPILVMAWLVAVNRTLWRPGLVSISLLLLVGITSFFLHPQDVRPLNALLALVTHGSLVLAVSSIRLEAKKIPTLVQIVAILSIFEGGLGSFQLISSAGGLFFDSMAAGDAVVGTLGGNSHLYAIKMLSQAVFLGVAIAFGITPRGTRLGFAFALLGSILGSALFSSALILGAIVVFGMFAPLVVPQRRAKKAVRRLQVVSYTVFALFLAVSVVIQRDNVQYAWSQVRQIPEIVSSPSAEEGTNRGKLIATLQALETWTSSPEMFMVGAGPGHYSSRAALILSGGYLTSMPEFVPVSLSEYTEAEILPLWNPSVWGIRYQGGVLNQPFHQYMTLITEVGLVGVVVVLCLVVAMYRRMAPARAHDMRAVMFRTAATVLLTALLAVGLSDNWLEYPHFVAPILAFIASARSVQ